MADVSRSLVIVGILVLVLKLRKWLLYWLKWKLRILVLELLNLLMRQILILVEMRLIILRHFRNQSPVNMCLRGIWHILKNLWLKLSQRRILKNVLTTRFWLIITQTN